MTIGNKIKMRRQELGYSQDDLARKMGYKSRSTINKIELGINDITQTKVVEFARALDTTVSYLMGWSEQKETPTSTSGDELNNAMDVIIDAGFLDLSEANQQVVRDLIHSLSKKQSSEEK